jgi:hypothetical protein
MVSVLFNDKMETLGNGESIVFLLDEESFITIKPDLIKYKKKGYRIISSSLIL